MDVAKSFVCFVVVGYVLCCGVGDSVGQDRFESVVIVDCDGKRGTGFCVSDDSESVEVWTVGHVTGEVGSEAVIVFSGGRRSTGVVSWRSYDGKPDGEDQAKIVCPRPDGEVSTIRVCEDDCDAHKSLTFVGARLGIVGQRQVRVRIQDDQFIKGRVIAFPGSSLGDSGGPVVNRDRVVVGVVSQCTVERFPRLLFIPIDKWEDCD